MTKCVFNFKDTVLKYTIDLVNDNPNMKIEFSHFKWTNGIQVRIPVTYNDSYQNNINYSFGEIVKASAERDNYKLLIKVLDYLDIPTNLTLKERITYYQLLKD